MTQVYVAARTADRWKAAQLAYRLLRAGHLPVSTWHGKYGDLVKYGDLGKPTLKHHAEGKDDDYNPVEARQEAVRDAKELDDADLLVSISSDDLSNGGKHFELGYVLGRGKFVAVIGRREHVFHHHPRVAHFDTEDDFLAAMEAMLAWQG